MKKSIIKKMILISIITISTILLIIFSNQENKYINIGKTTQKMKQTTETTPKVFTPEDRPYNIKFTQVESQSMTIALDEDGNIWTWGINNRGQLGTGTKTDKLVPTQITTNGNFKYVTTSGVNAAAIDKNGNIWTWGAGGKGGGRLGNVKNISSLDSSGYANDVTIPTQITSGTKFTKIIMNYSTCIALDENGNIWGWGEASTGTMLNKGKGNYHYQMNDTDPGDWYQTYPIQITTGKRYIDIDLSMNNIALIDSNNNLWVAGKNGNSCNSTEAGILGVTDDTYTIKWYNEKGTNYISVWGSYDLIQIGLGKKWTSVKLFGNTGILLDDQNERYEWGKWTFNNTSTTENITSPRKHSVSSHKISNISAGENYIIYYDIEKEYYVIEGINDNGCFGNGSESSSRRYTTNWPLNYNSVKANNFGTTTWAFDADGSLWMCGNNNNGQIGNGNKTNQTTFLQITGTKYSIKFNTNGGIINSGEISDYAYGTEVTLPTDVTKQGYTFAGWYDNISLTGNPITSISATDRGDKEYYAKWTANTANYTVEHYLQNNDLRGYTKTDTETKVGNIGAIATAVPKTYEGYIENTTHKDRVKTGTVLEDGTLILKLYYDRNIHTVTFKDKDKEVTQTVEHGSVPTPPNWTKPGYTASWNPSLGNVTSDIIINVVWVPRTDTPYKVEHYVRSLDMEVETYELYETENKTGTTDQTITAIPKTYNGFTENTTYSERVPSGTITADGTLVLKLYYDRNSYNIIYELNGGTATSTLTNKYIYGKEMILSNKVSREGYKFIGWYNNSSLSGSPISKILNTDVGNKTFYAKWAKEDEYYITSEKYNIDTSKNYITKVSPNTTVSAFINNIDTNGTGKIIDLNGVEVKGDSLVGTGYKLQTTYNGEIYTYEIAVRGDLDGNGKTTITDLSIMNQIIVGKTTLTGIREKAADIDYSGKISITDLSMMNQAIVGSKKL